MMVEVARNFYFSIGDDEMFRYRVKPFSKKLAHQKRSI